MTKKLKESHSDIADFWFYRIFSPTLFLYYRKTMESIYGFLLQNIEVCFAKLFAKTAGKGLKIKSYEDIWRQSQKLECLSL